MLTIHKVFLEKYDTSQFSVIDYHLIDVLLFAAFMYVFRPQEVPANFTADLGDLADDNKFMNIFKAKISKFQESENDFTNEDIEIPSKEYNIYKNDKHGTYPIIVLNPMFGGSSINDTNSRSSDYYSSITYRCEHLQIGYVKHD